MKTKKSKPEEIKTKVSRPSKTVQNQVMTTRQAINAVRMGMQPPVALKPQYSENGLVNPTLKSGYDMVDAYNDLQEARKTLKIVQENKRKAYEEKKKAKIIEDYRKQQAIDELNKKIAPDKPLDN